MKKIITIICLCIGVSACSTAPKSSGPSSEKQAVDQALKEAADKLGSMAGFAVFTNSQIDEQATVRWNDVDEYYLDNEINPTLIRVLNANIATGEMAPGVYVTNHAEEISAAEYTAVKKDFPSHTAKLSGGTPLDPEETAGGYYIEMTETKSFEKESVLAGGTGLWEDVSGVFVSTNFIKITGNKMVLDRSIQINNNKIIFNIKPSESSAVYIRK